MARAKPDPSVLLRPMLAVKAADLRALRFPVLASPKLDGVRAVCRRNPITGAPELVSRTLKPIPNRYTQALFARADLVGLDGELCVGPANDANVMQATTSGVMSVEGEPDVVWHVFDKWNEPTEYVFRAATAMRMLRIARLQQAQWLSQRAMYSYDTLAAYEDEAVNAGYEGLIVRDPRGLYKQNRSTVKEGYLLKVKRFEDSEAVVLGFVEQQRNNNEVTLDERGYTKRSTHAANKSNAGVLGALQVKDIHTGVPFDIGTGFTAEQRANLWEGRRYLVGKLVKYKFFPIGVVDAPRFPTFIGFRDEKDL